MENLTLEEQRLLQDELSNGESLLWMGKPNTRVIFHATDWYMVPFSLLWGGFAIFWEAGVSGLGPFSGKGSWSFGMLWGIPFVLIGQYMIWGRFFYAAWKKKRILYALTSERLFTLVRPPQQKIVSIYLRSVPGIDKQIRRDGIGTLKFGETPPMWATGRNNKTADALYLNSSTPVFVDIDDAANVATRVSQQLRLLAQAPSRSQER
jgi:hypothetical protein